MTIRSGSSPRARGTQLLAVDVPSSPRFIPACAGNAALSALRRSWAAVHPRMRGERDIFKKPVGEFDGSSPHARGTRQTEIRVSCRRRFIPACAGNAIAVASAMRAITVHPRMRGERLVPERCATNEFGSSPHARGTPFHIAAHNLSLRFIPACAGNACCGCKQDSVNAVHPRMRGERGAKLTTQTRNVGSSPHARGTRIQRN